MVGDPEIATRIAAYEMAGRLQTAGPGTDRPQEGAKETLDLYGADPDKPSLRAGVPAGPADGASAACGSSTIYHEGWDAHSDVAGNLRNNCGATDKASAALVADLKRRGMLDSTLVDVGRRVRPHADGGIEPGARAQPRPRPPPAGVHDVDGRRRHQGRRHATARPTTSASTPWRTRVHVHDVQATILHLLGFDHEKLTYRHAGRDFRLTDVFGKVIKEVLA